VFAILVKFIYLPPVLPGAIPAQADGYAGRYRMQDEIIGASLAAQLA
jgi:hypothetical protein